ncbi:MAG: EMC3/TMCO1 family protein, partial [Halobacteriaceae archaeon]
ENFRPFVYIMLITIPVFVWMYWLTLEHPGQLGKMVLPLAGETGYNVPVGPFPSFIVWYFVCSLAFGNLIRKTLNVQTSPT